MTARGFGFLPEAPGQHDSLVVGADPDGPSLGRNPDASAVLAGAAPVPEEVVRLVTALPPFKNQEDTNTCVPHAIFNIAEASLTATGSPIEPSSVPQLYCTTNALVQPPGTPLQDLGTYGRVALQVTKEWGVARDVDYPFRDSRTARIIPGIVTTAVPPDVHQRATSWKLDEQSTIYAQGQDRLRTVDVILAAIGGVVAAGVVDSKFMNYQGRGVLGAPDLQDARGRHMTAIIGYRTNKTTRRREYLIRNSWPQWGLVLMDQVSLAWVDQDWVLAQEELYRLRVSRGRRTS